MIAAFFTFTLGLLIRGYQKMPRGFRREFDIFGIAQTIVLTIVCALSQ